MSHSSSRKEIEKQIERTVVKYLGSSEHSLNSIVSSALKCVKEGYDKRKTSKKLSSYLDEKTAAKLADKIFITYDDYKNSQLKKRPHNDSHADRSRDRDSKRFKDDSSRDDSKHSSLPEDKSHNVLASGLKEIEQRKKELKVATKAVKPILANTDLTAVGSVYNQGFLSKIDSDKAKKMAALKAAIDSKLKNAGHLLANLPKPDKPVPLILNESGKMVDSSGKEIQLAHALPTLKANIRAKKREEFKAQLQDSKSYDDLQETHFFDNRIEVKPFQRGKRALKFHEQGKFVEMARRIRMKAQLEKLQNEISQSARKTGISSATKLALIAPKIEAHSEDVTNVEWWDSVILNGDDYNTDMSDINNYVKVSTITNLVEHPTQMRPPTEPSKVYMPVFLTKKERKKLRRQNRREAWKEEQEKIRLGLEAPPEPKLRISNLMRVLGTEAVQDPTKIEAHVRQQMAKRVKAHEEANAARKLTVDQRREKKAKKLKEDTSLGVHVAVFRIRDLMNNASKKFKVETNAKQLYLTGCVMLYRDCNVVAVEGGVKQISKYKRLMLQRIKWEEDIVKDMDGNEVPNKCVLVWEGTAKHRNFGEIKFKVCPMEKNAREHFKKHQVEQYWDLAYSGAVLDNTDEI